MKGKHVIAVIAALLCLASAGCAGAEKPQSQTEGTPLFEFWGGDYAALAENYEKEPPAELRCRFDGEARVECTVSDEETIKHVLDALSVITVTGEQVDTFAADNTEVFTFVMADGSELPFEFNSENLVLTGKRGGIYELKNTEKLGMASFHIQSEANEQAPAPDDDFAAAVSSAIEAREDYTLSVDDGDPLFVETGVKNILFFADGTGALELTGQLAQTYGDKVKICENALAGNVFTYGNGGWRVIIFLMEDGSLTVINPARLYNNHEIQAVEKFAGLSRVIAIDEMSGEYETTVVATDIDGNTYTLDGYLSELS